eukprot:798800-Rhodomonas_salina.2
MKSGRKRTLELPASFLQNIENLRKEHRSSSDSRTQPIEQKKRQGSGSAAVRNNQVSAIVSGKRKREVDKVLQPAENKTNGDSGENSSRKIADLQIPTASFYGPTNERSAKIAARTRFKAMKVSRSAFFQEFARQKDAFEYADSVQEESVRVFARVSFLYRPTHSLCEVWC